jgi:hypothetical protein
MSLDGNRGRRNEEKKGSNLLKGAAFGGAMLGAGVMGIDAGARNTWEELNRHVLTPRVVQELKNETNATDVEIGKLEERLKPLLLQELRRSMNRQ